MSCESKRPWRILRSLTSLAPLREKSRFNCAIRRNRSPIVIAQISGKLAQKQPGEVVIDVGGVGYQVFIPLNVFYRLPDVGAPMSLQIHTHVREDALQLFGFHDLAEKQVFLLLIGVSGIGPKLALNILSGIPAEELARALKKRRSSALGGDSRRRQEARRADDRRVEGQIRHPGADDHR